MDPCPITAPIPARPLDLSVGILATPLSAKNTAVCTYTLNHTINFTTIPTTTLMNWTRLHPHRRLFPLLQEGNTPIPLPLCFNSAPFPTTIESLWLSSTSQTVKLTSLLQPRPLPPPKVRSWPFQPRLLPTPWPSLPQWCTRTTWTWPQVPQFP